MLTNNRYYFRIREFVPPAVASDKAQYTTVARQHGAASPRISWDALLIFSVPSNYSCLSDPCVNGRGTDMTIREFQVQGREDGSGSRPLSLSLSLSLSAISSPRGNINQHQLLRFSTDYSALSSLALLIRTLSPAFPAFGTHHLPSLTISKIAAIVR